MGTKESEFTEKLRMLIDERDMKQKDVAAALHIPVSTLACLMVSTMIKCIIGLLEDA